MMRAIPKTLFKKIHRLEIEAGRLADEMMVGLYHSVFKGQGMEFEEVRAFVDGDDIRTIDWNVTARMGSPYVKRLREERELTVFLIVDLSASTRLSGSGNKLKREAIAEVGALLAFTAIKNHDRVGLILFSDKVEQVLLPKKGWRHALRLVRDLLAFKPTGNNSDMAAALHTFSQMQKRSAIAFLISDFLCPLPRRLLATSAKQHDLIALQISDPAETTLPPIGLVHLVDPETDTSITIDSSSPQLHQHHHAHAQQRQRQCKETIQRAGGSFLSLPTDRSYVVALRRFFQSRKIRH